MTYNRDLKFVLTVTALGLLLRLWKIDADLWLDEIMSLVDYMRLTPLESVSFFNAPNQHVLNSFLGSISVSLFGESALAVRLPALLFGVATIPVFFKLAMLVTERREAVFATLFLTLSYHHVWFSQNARGYSAMVFFTALSTLVLFKWLASGKTPEKKTAAIFVIYSCLGMLSLLNYAFVLAGQFTTTLLLLINRKDWSAVKYLLSGGAAILVLTLLGYSSMLKNLMSYFSGGQASYNLSDVLAFMQVLADGLTSGLSLIAIPVLFVGAIVALTGWLSYWKRHRLIALMLVLPVFFNVVALLLLKFGWYPRSFLFILPFGILVIIRGLFVLGESAIGRFKINPRFVYLFPSLLLLASAVMLSHNYRYPKQDHTGSLAYTRSQAAPGDVIAVVGYLSYGYKQMYAPELAFPQDAEELKELQGPNHRVWVLYSYTQTLRELLPGVNQALETDFVPYKVFPGTLGDGTVFLRVTPQKDGG